MVLLLVVGMWALISLVIGHIEFTEYILYVLMGLKGLQSSNAKEVFNFDYLNFNFELDDLLELAAAGIFVVTSLMTSNTIDLMEVIISVVYGVVLYVFFIRTMSRKIFNK